MQDELNIDFYRDRDEDTFLQAYETAYGELTEDQIDALYEDIARAISKEIDEGTHRLGKPFLYKDVLVGTSDFSQTHSLYLFTQE